MNSLTFDVNADTTIWQCGCGSVREGIDYSNVCLEHDVIMIGPGDCGPYPDCLISPDFEPACERNGESADSARIYIRQIASEVAGGEIVVLKRGLSHVYAVGLVERGYQYNHNFSNIGGWNVAHSRRVRWLWRDGWDFDRNILPRERLSRIQGVEVRGWLETIRYPESEMTRPLHPLPA